MTTLTQPLISKKCCTCKEELPASSFHKNNSTKTGLANECKACKKVRAKNYYHSNTDKWRDKHYSAAYNLSIEEYVLLLAKQEGKCAICKCTESRDGTRFAVDHCHDTGKVRGLLCRPCNSAIGFLKDDYHNALAAARYLEASQPTYT
jgi:hypothetical protein